MDRKIAEVIDEIRIAHLLTGSRTPAELRAAPKIIGPNLKRWNFLALLWQSGSSVKIKEPFKMALFYSSQEQLDLS